MRERKEEWDIESTYCHGTNLASFKIVSGIHWIPLIGDYLPPTILDRLPGIEEALNCFLGRDPIVLGDLSTDVGRMGNPQDQQVVDFLVSFGLVDFLSHFRQSLRFRNMKTWWQVLQGKLLHSRCDYILRSGRQLFETVGIWDMRNFSSGHLSLHARLLRCTTWCHIQYLRWQQAFPLRLP